MDLHAGGGDKGILGEDTPIEDSGVEAGDSADDCRAGENLREDDLSADDSGR